MITICIVLIYKTYYRRNLLEIQNFTEFAHGCFLPKIPILLLLVTSAKVVKK